MTTSEETELYIDKKRQQEKKKCKGERERELPGQRGGERDLVRNFGFCPKC